MDLAGGQVTIATVDLHDSVNLARRTDVAPFRPNCRTHARLWNCELLDEELTPAAVVAVVEAGHHTTLEIEPLPEVAERDDTNPTQCDQRSTHRMCSMIMSFTSCTRRIGSSVSL